MCLQVGMQTGARVDMALTDLTMGQGTETGWEYILSSSNQHVAAVPFPFPFPPPSPHPSQSILCILLLHLVLQSMRLHPKRVKYSLRPRHCAAAVAAASVMTTEAASMTEGALTTGARIEGTAGAMVLDLSKKSGAATSGTVAALITVSSRYWCTVSRFARNVKAGMPCAGRVFHSYSATESVNRVILWLSVAMQ